MNEGLKIKYDVFKVSDGSPVYDCFVLRPDKDPAALEALKVYASVTNNKTLAKDIYRWIGDENNITNNTDLRASDFREIPRGYDGDFILEGNGWQEGWFSDGEGNYYKDRG
jgi:hypothetical protein